MKRSNSIKADNLFLSSSQTLREKRVSIVFVLVFQSLIFLSVAFGMYACMVSIQFKLAMQQQADAVGQSLLTQTAERATELLATGDDLGVNILLGSLAKNPLVANVAIYDDKGNELFKAGLKQLTHESSGALYRESLVIQKQSRVELRLHLNKQQFQLPWMVSVERAIIIAGALLFIALVFIFRLGRKITLPLIQLREWLRDPVMPAPASSRCDEVGDLAKDLQEKLIPAEQIEAYLEQFLEAKLVPKKEEIAEEATIDGGDELTHSNFDQAFLQEIRNFDDVKLEKTVATTNIDNIPVIVDAIQEEKIITYTAVLFIRIGGQNKLRLLPKDRLINLLQRYRDCLGQAARLYNGEIHTLNDGSSLILFHGRGNQTELYLIHAICCGELMRGFSHELQIELADTDITSLLQIALAQGTELLGLTQQELMDNETVKAVQLLADHSRNLLLIDQSIATNNFMLEKLARIRALANPIDAYCVERVMEPYAETLEKQLRVIRNSRL